MQMMLLAQFLNHKKTIPIKKSIEKSNPAVSPKLPLMHFSYLTRVDKIIEAIIWEDPGF